jgi:ABC-2 type transport system ATP-binding protein
MVAAIEIEGLCKTYRRKGGTTNAVDDLTLSVPEGGVFGFLGPNGSGKTTTIRCLLGLVAPTEGTVRILGRPIPDQLPAVMPSIGAIVEAPAMFPTMTGFENLRLLAAVDGIGDQRVLEMLDQVGLAERSRDLVKRYSLGMRQRLGLAAALLKDPALVILDEPANGLDPAGLKEVRQLLRSLSEEGRTVFVSSHLLSEVEHTCDAVAILNHGRCVAQGTVSEVMARATGSAALVVTVDDLDAGNAALISAGLPTQRQNGSLRVEVPQSRAAEVTQTLAAQELWVTSLRAEEQSLEDLFLEITRDDNSTLEQEVTS